MHPKIAGSPDIILKKSKTAVFLHGCFWHKCPRCSSLPKSNKKYWLAKLEKNVQRDKKNIRLLKKEGWTVFVFWGHELKKNSQKIAEKLRRL